MASVVDNLLSKAIGHREYTPHSPTHQTMQLVTTSNYATTVDPKRVDEVELLRAASENGSL